MLLRGEEYTLKEINGRIVLYRGNSTIYPEEHIEIEKQISNDKFIVAEVHRDIKQIKKPKKERKLPSMQLLFIKDYMIIL